MSTINTEKEIHSVVQMTFSGLYGGRENVAFSLTKLLGDTIHTSVLYLILETRANQGHKRDLLTRLEQSKIRYRIFQIDRRFSWKLAGEIAKALKEDGIQIVHCHCYKSAVYAVLIKYFKHLNRLIVAFTLHGLQIPFSLNSLSLRLMNLFAIHSVDSIIGCSREIVAPYASTPFLKQKIAVIQNGYIFDADKVKKYMQQRDDIRDRIAERYGLDKNALWIGNVGRLTAQKNHALFLNAIHKIKKEAKNLPKADFLIVGDGGLKDELLQQAKELAINDVVFFTGHVSDMNEIYASLDIQVLSSDWEGTPMCILEGMSYGLPVVATSVGGIADLIEHDKSGMLSPQGDMEHLIEHMVSLMSDKQKRNHLGVQAQNCLQSSFTAESWVEQHMLHYAGLLKKNSSAEMYSADYTGN